MNQELINTMEEKPFLLTLMTMAIGFIGIAITVIGLTTIITSPQSGIPLTEDTFNLLAQLTSYSSLFDIQIGSGMFLGGVIILIVGSGLHQMRKWALQAMIAILLIGGIFSLIYTLNFLGTLSLFGTGGFETFNGFILPLLCYCIFFLIYLFTVRHYFD